MCMGHCDYPTNFASAKFAFETDCQEERSLVRQPSPIQWNLHNTDTVGTTSNCPYYRCPYFGGFQYISGRCGNVYLCR